MKLLRLARRAGVWGGSLALAVTLVTTSAPAQTPSTMDAQGDLVAMPFEPDVPIVRTSVDRTGDATAFVTVTSWSYDRTIAHYREYYSRRAEVAPGWTIRGFGYDVGEQCMVFTLTWETQTYRLEVRPDEASGGAVITVHDRVNHLPYRPRVHTVAPYRATDVGPIPFEND